MGKIGMHFHEYSRPQVNSKGLVIFDRDGTLIQNYKGLSRIEFVKWLPGRIEALNKLTSLGYIIAIATNQGALEEGLLRKEELLEVHRNMVEEANNCGVKIWAIIFCPHSKLKSGKDCECRKPRPGMILELKRRLNLSDSRLVLFGDKESDLQAANSSGLDIDSFMVNNNNFTEIVDRWIQNI